MDVTATNPDGSSVTLAGGFTYKAATLDLSKVDVGAGDSVIVTWSGPPSSSEFGPRDVIELYSIADPSGTALWTMSCECDHSSKPFSAPHEPGVYEVRYLMFGKFLLAKATLVVR